VQPQQQLLVERVERVVIQPARIEAEADDVEVNRRDKFQFGRRCNQPSQVARLRRVLRDEPAVLRDPVLAQRHPDLERAKAARQLYPVLAGPARTRGQAAFSVFQVLRGEAEGAAMRGLVAHEHAAGLELHVQPLVEVQADRVGTRQARQAGAQVRREDRQRADSAVHVEPQPFARSNVGQHVEGVQRAAVDRARVADETDGLHPRSAVRGQRGFQRRHVDPEGIVNRNQAQALAA